MESNQTNHAPEQTATPPPAPAPAPESTNTGAPAPKQKNSTTLIVAIVGGLLAVGLIGWLVYSALFAIKPEDYRQAGEAANQVVLKGSSSTSSLTRVGRISSSGTETTVNNDLEAADKALAEFKQAHAELEGKKALRDADVSEAYDEYSETYKSYIQFAEGYLPSAKQVLPVIIGCEEDSRAVSLSSRDASAVAELRNSVKPCMDKLAELKDVKDEDLKKFAATYGDTIKRMLEIVDEAAALDSSDFRAASELRRELNDLMRSLSSAQRDANSNIQKRLDDVHPREDINELASVIREKIRS